METQITTNKPWLFQRGNPGGGRKKGSLSVKSVLQGIISKNKGLVEQMLNSMIKKSIDGDHKSFLALMEILGERRQLAPNIDIANTQVTVMDEVVARAKEYAKLSQSQPLPEVKIELSQPTQILLNKSPDVIPQLPEPEPIKVAPPVPKSSKIVLVGSKEYEENLRLEQERLSHVRPVITERPIGGGAMIWS